MVLIKLTVKIYNKSFVDQACSVKMAEYWLHSSSFFVGMFMDLKFALSLSENIKKNTPHLVNNSYLLKHWRKGIYFQSFG